MLSKFFILVKRGLELFIKNLSLHFVSITTVATILFIFNIFFIIGYSVDFFIKNMVDIQTVRVYLNTDNKKEIDKLIDQIKEMRSIDEVKYYSSKETYEYLKDSNFNTKYLKMIPKDFFPAFIEVKINPKYRKLKFVKEIETNLSDFKIVDMASFGESWIMNFLSFRYGIHFFLVVLTILLIISMSSIIYNTIKISLFRYKEQIRIYNLVGATRSFIILPFIFTIIIEMTISFIISMLVTIFIFKTMNSFLLESININFLLIPKFYLYIIFYFIVIVISVLASFLSISSFLNKMGAINDN
jgi:cell division transport system permease protein